MDRLTIVSCDSHAGLPSADYRPYFDPEYRDAADLNIRDNQALRPILGLLGYPFSDEVLDVIDYRGAIRSGGEASAYDPQRRIKEAEAEGVVAEVLFSGVLDCGPAPLVDPFGSRYSLELRAAGARAYNRWAAEFCSAAPGRLIGLAHTEPWPDMAAAVAQVREAGKAGFRGVLTDQFAGLDDEGPGLWDRSWDPYWAACVDLDLVLHIHVGFGLPQGRIQGIVREIVAALESSEDPSSVAGAHGELQDAVFPSRGPLWQLMWGGVLDRYPDLKIVFVEQHAGWIPATLAYLDQVHARGGSPLTMKPSEYWRERNLAVTCTSVRPSDLEGRPELGIDKMMFGTDFPHAEGTWPNTTEWLRAALVGLPEDEARAFLGDNAIRFYGLDRAQLEEVAARIGPLPSDIFGEYSVDPRLIEHFDHRSGYNKSQLANYDEAELANAVDHDIRAIELSRAS